MHQKCFRGHSPARLNQQSNAENAMKSRSRESQYFVDTKENYLIIRRPTFFFLILPSLSFQL